MTDPGITELRALADHVDPWQRWGSVSHFIRSGYSVNVAEYLAAASPDVILALCDRLAEVEAIINDQTQVGWLHDEVGSMKVLRLIGTMGIGKAIHLKGDSETGWIYCGDCPDCIPIYICQKLKMADIEWEYAVQFTGRGGDLFLRGASLEDCAIFASRCDERWGAGMHVVVRRPKPTAPEWEIVEYEA